MGILMDILGIGECMIEMTSVGNLSEASDFHRQVGGDVYNTLVAASRLGSKAAFFSRIGKDQFGKVLLRHFEDNGIDTAYVQYAQDGYNGLYFIAMQENGRHEFIYYRRHSAGSQLSPEMIRPEMIADARVVYASGITQAISPSARASVLKVFQLAKAQGITVAYDPNYRPSLWRQQDVALDAMVEVLPYVDIFLPSQDDLALLFGFMSIADILEYFRLKGVALVVLKQASDGVTLSFRRQVAHVPAYATDRIKDTVGAGDAFNGGFLHGLLQGQSILACAELGVMVAGLSLRETGPIQGLPVVTEAVSDKTDSVEDLVELVQDYSLFSETV